MIDWLISECCCLWMAGKQLIVLCNRTFRGCYTQSRKTVSSFQPNWLTTQVRFRTESVTMETQQYPVASHQQCFLLLFFFGGGGGGGGVSIKECKLDNFFMLQLWIVGCWLFFFKINFSLKNHFRNTIRVSNDLDPEQVRHTVSPCLKLSESKLFAFRLSADNKSCH